jgi:hypothetical protein
MPTVTRVSGDSKHVTYTDMGSMVATGIGKYPVAVKITLAAAGDLTLGGNVESAIRIIQVKASTLVYQVNGSKLSVLLEATGWASDAELLAALGALATAVDSTGGFNLA